MPELEKESAMEKNGVNGGHQHEVSEKRVNPATFPCRLDMELCACGAKRWVDLQGRPATPWQFINLGTMPRGQEGARAAPRTSPKSVLDGLITCGSCGQPMTLDDAQRGQEALYACEPGPGQSRCPTPRLHARSAEVLLIGKVLQTVLTDETISRVLDAANNPQAVRRSTGTQADQAGPTGGQGKPGTLRPGHRQDLLESREFLGRFIAGIRIHAEKAVICYSIPLPEDSPLAGMRRQEIDLPEEMLAW